VAETVNVTCVTVGDPASKSDGWLTVGRDYVVLTILALPGSGGVRLRVLADDGRTPILADSGLFAAENEPLPNSWVGPVTQRGALQLGPAAWLESGFWERFFDRDPAAVDAFHRELDTLGGL
jgi:hypothetical protein